MEKLTLQAVSELYAKKYGASRKFAESFSKAFFETIIEGLRADGIVKISNFGTFKVIAVADRESVNVNNGERIIIPGYRKVIFTPYSEFVDMASPKEGNTHEDVLEEVVVSEEIAENIDADVHEFILPPFDENINLSNIEIPMNEIGSIDTLISTPESIEDVRQRFEDAKLKADEAYALAQQAHTEMLKLKTLLSRLESNESPASDGVTPSAENVDTVPDVEEQETTEQAPSEVAAAELSDAESTSEQSTEESDAPAVSSQDVEAPSEPSKKDIALQNIMNKKNEEETETDGDDKRKKMYVWICAAVLLIVASVGAIYYYYSQSQPKDSTHRILVDEPKIMPADTLDIDTVSAEKDSVSAATTTEKKQEPLSVRKSVKSDAASQKGDAVKKDDASKGKDQVKKNSSKPKTHTIAEGESLTKISRKYYGTKDSVNAIIRINAFQNPDNIAVGTVVELP